MRTFTQTAARILILLFGIQIVFVALTFYSVQIFLRQTAEVNAEDTVLSIAPDLREDLVLHFTNGNREAFDFIVYELIQTKRLEYAGFVVASDFNQYLGNRPDASHCSQEDLVSGKVCESVDGSSLFGAVALSYENIPLGYLVQQVSLDQFLSAEDRVSFLQIGSALGLVFILNVAGVLVFLPRRLGKDIKKLQSLIYDNGLDGNSQSGLTIRELDDVANVLKEASAARRSAEEIGRKAAKAEAMMSTAQMLAHDIRTPFSTIRAGMTLLSRASTHEDYTALVSNLSAELNRQERSVNHMLEDLLEVGRKVEPVVIVCYLERTLVEAIAAASAASTRQSVPLVWDLGHTRDLRVNLSKISRVFANIFANAFDAIEASCSEVKEIHIRTNDSGTSGLEIAITNTGSSIDAEFANTIFDPFVSRGKAKGTGLGLAVAKKVVEDHHGSIVVESDDKKNEVTFILVLPGVTRQGIEASKMPGSTDQASAWRSHIVME